MTNKKKVLLIGWDAADWKIINKLVDNGEMPAMENMINNGVMGNLATLDPPFSPMLWTSIATGMRPDKHGILGFVEPTPDKIGVRPVSSTSRKVKAIWNILTQENYKTHVVGWWPSHPVEQINGVMISNHYPKMNDSEPKPLPNGSVHPTELTRMFAHLRVHPTELTKEHLLPFVPKASKIDQELDKRLFQIAKNIAEASSIHAATTWIAENQEWDFLAMYLDTIDHFSHGFMNYHPPKMKGISDEDYEIYKEVINSSYKFHDMMLGRLMELAGEDTTIIIVSDHGFHSDHLRPKLLPDEPAGPANQHRDFGIICMKGPGIKKDERVFGASILDITPTLLNMYGLPIGSDMDGIPLVQCFKNPNEVERIESWDKVEGKSGMLPAVVQEDPYEAQESLRQLVELGYIEEPEEDMKKNVEKTVIESEYNLARVFMGAKQYIEAIPILEKLFKAEPSEARFAFRLYDSYVNVGNIGYCEELLESFKKAINDKIIPEDELKKIAKEKMPEGLSDEEKEKFAKQKHKDLMNNKRIMKDLLQADLKQADLFILKGKPKQAFKIFEHITQLAPNNPLLQISIGNSYLKTSQWQNAIESFLNALEFDPENNHAFYGLSVAYLRTNQLEESIEAALDSINLVYHNPFAHYHLGEALYKLEDYMNAANALNVCLTMNPNIGKARNLLIHIYETHLDDPKMANHLKSYYKQEDKEEVKTDKGTTKFKPEANIVGMNPELSESLQKPIIIVSGLPRSGTSLMMQMVEKGGIEIFTDNERKADENNPKGYYEHEAVKSLARENRWMNKINGKAIKVISHLLINLPTRFNYKIIFMNRDIEEVVISQHKMLVRDGKAKADSYPANIKMSFLKSLQKVEVWAKKSPNVEILYVDHSDVIKNPAKEAQKVACFLEIDADINKMSAIVDKNLYRERNV